MSQPRGPDPERHPDEALAAYVDGSASPAEVSLARTHLSSCARCREEVEVARGAVRALKDLPELDPPWVDAGQAVGGAAANRAGGDRRVRSLDERRGRTRAAVVAAVGLAAAASVAVVLLLVHPGGSARESATGPVFAAQGGAPNVTGADLSELTARLAGSTRAPSSKASGAAGLGGAGSASPGGSQPHLPANPTIAPGAVAGVPCARRASGQSDSAVVVYAQVAVFQGKRVWIVGFVTTPASGGSPRVEVVAATTNGCTVVFVGRQPLAATP